MHASVCNEISLWVSHSMEKQQANSAVIKHLGMCEKLYNAFQPTLRPLRRLTFRQQAATADSSTAVHSDHHPIPQSKLPEPAAPPPGKAQLPKAKKSPKPEPLPTPAPPKAEVKPVGAVPQPLPPLPPPSKAEVQKPKKGINERVDEYISRTRGRIRSTVSGVGRVPPTK